jgi:hypothetical protein
MTIEHLISLYVGLIALTAVMVTTLAIMGMYLV